MIEKENNTIDKEVDSVVVESIETPKNITQTITIQERAESNPLDFKNLEYRYDFRLALTCIVLVLCIIFRALDIRR